MNKVELVVMKKINLICHLPDIRGNQIIISQMLTPLMMISQMLTPLAAGPCSVEPQAVDATTEAKKNLKIIELWEIDVLSFGYPAKMFSFTRNWSKLDLFVCWKFSHRSPSCWIGAGCRHQHDITNRVWKEDKHKKMQAAEAKLLIKIEWDWYLSKTFSDDNSRCRRDLIRGRWLWCHAVWSCIPFLNSQMMRMIDKLKMRTKIKTKGFLSCM